MQLGRNEVQHLIVQNHSLIVISIVSVILAPSVLQPLSLTHTRSDTGLEPRCSCQGAVAHSRWQSSRGACAAGTVGRTAESSRGLSGFGRFGQTGETWQTLS